MPTPAPADFVEESSVKPQAAPSDFSETDVPAPSVMDPHPIKSLGKRIGRAVTDPKFLARQVPPIAIQGVAQAGGALAGAAVGGPAGVLPGEVAGGATGSVISDVYERFLDRMFGEEGKPLTVSGEAKSAALGAAGPLAVAALPRVAEAATGLSTARKVATGAFEDAKTAGADLLGEQAEVRSIIARKQAAEDAKAAIERTKLLDQQRAAREGIAAGRQTSAQKALAGADKTAADIQGQIDQSRADLRQTIAKGLEQKREAAATKVGTQQIEQTIGKTPQQLAAQEALPYEKYAPIRAKVQSSYFDNELAFHNEIGQKFEKYIGPVKNEPLHADNFSGLKSDLDAISNTVDQRGQRLVSADLKKVFDEITPEKAAPVDTAKTQLMDRLREQNPGINPTDKEGRPIFGAGEQAPTVGQLWGARARLGAVARSSSNPADRWAAIQGMDAITKHLPNIPENIRQEYSLSKSLYDPSTARKVATARTPAEVGEAIFGGSLKNAEPPQVALNLIRKAETPEQLQGLRDAFADNWLSKPRDPDEFGRYLQTHRDVVRGLYGDKAPAIEKMFGPEGSVKSASWDKLLRVSPEAKTDFENAYRETMRSQQAIAIRQAITDGEKALRELPNRYDAVKKALDGASTPEAKLAILQKELPTAKQIEPTEAQAATLAKTPPDPRQAAIDTLTGKSLPPNRMEGYVQRRLVFDAMVASTAGYGLLAKNPTIGVVGGAILGGRELIRRVLKNPTIAETYVNMLKLGAEPKNASRLGKLMGGMMAGTVLQTIKDDHDPENAPTLSEAPR